MDGGSSIAPERALAASFAANADKHDRDGSFPFENFQALHRAGLLAATVPDGENAGLGRACDLVASVAEGCASTALVFAMQLITVKLSASWPAEPRRKLLDSIRASGALVNGLRVEAALGTPARGGLPETVARRATDGWRLSGRKIYSTGSPGLRWGVVTVRTDEEPVRTGLLLVPMDAPGVRVIETWDQLGLRASGSHDVVFADVPVPAGNVVALRPPTGWSQGDVTNVAWNTTVIAALYTGVAAAARSWVVRFLQERVPSNLGAPLATLPRMQEAVGAIEALIVTNRRAIGAIAGDHDAGVPVAPWEFGLVKTQCAENSIAAVEGALKLCGNHGLSRANPLERHMRDVLCARVHTPQPDAAYSAAGRALLESVS